MSIYMIIAICVVLWAVSTLIVWLIIDFFNKKNDKKMEGLRSKYLTALTYGKQVSLPSGYGGKKHKKALELAKKDYEAIL